MQHLLLLSGAVGAGKTTLSSGLRDRYGARVIKTRELIAELLPHVDQTRRELQEAGDRLDRETAGTWIVQAIARLAPQEPFVVVDAVRRMEQVEAVRERFKEVHVQHVHLWASEDVLTSRYEGRARVGDVTTSYAEVRENLTEAEVNKLEGVCDVLIDTVRSLPKDVLVRAAARLGLYDTGSRPLVDVLISAQWGSEGKGHIAWYLAREYDVLVRVGGPNAGHSTKDPYKFHLLPSGTIVNPRARLIIGPGATLSVPTLLREIQECAVTSERLSIDPQAMIIEPSDVEYEQANLAGIGSTAQGGGYAAARRLMRGGLRDAAPVRLASDVPELSLYVRSTLEQLEDAYRNSLRVFVEGTQGAGLSLYHGHFPYVTSRDTTASGTLAECGIPPGRVRRVVMVVRSYSIRVAGTSGPLRQEITWDIVAERAGLDAGQLKKREVTTTTGRDRRVGEFDWEQFRRACSLNAPTDLALAFADYLDGNNENARRFEQLSPNAIRFIGELEGVAGANVSLITTRFHERSIIDRRAW